mgnify:CR=1 FL=1
MPTIRAFWAPKAAAFDEARQVVAVADGASSSYRAGMWSSRLVEEFLARPPQLAPGLISFHEWVASVADGFQSASEAVSETSWYASDASRRGSFATFVGVTLLSGVNGGRFGDARNSTNARRRGNRRKISVPGRPSRPSDSGSIAATRYCKNMRCGSSGRKIR